PAGTTVNAAALTRPRLRKVPTRSCQDAMGSSSVAGILDDFAGVVFKRAKPRADALFCQFARIYFRAGFSKERGRRGPCSVAANRWKPPAPPAETRRSCASGSSVTESL